MSVDISDRVFDAYTGEMGTHLMRETQRRVHWMCAEARGSSVLDVGCSQGLLPILLGREGKTVIGIDTSAAAIQSANDHLMREHVSVRRRVSFVEADLVGYHFGEAKFDCVVMGEILEHLLNPARIVGAAAALLAPGGRIVVTVPFGINDHVDHKRTFYLLEPLSFLEPYFELDAPVILGRWLGLVGTLRADSLPTPARLWSQEEVRRLETAFGDIERSLVDELSMVRGRLDEANVKYRSSNEEISRLKRELAHHDGERKSLERVRAQLEQLSQTATASAPDQAELRTAHHAAVQEARARELEAVRLEERLTHATQLRTLELAVRDGELARLQKDREELGRRAAESEKSAAASQESSRSAEARLIATEQRARDAEESATTARKLALHADARANEAEHHASDANRRAERAESLLHAEALRNSEALCALQGELQDATLRASAAARRIAELEGALEEMRQQAIQDAQRADERLIVETARAQAALEQAQHIRDELRVAQHASASAQTDLTKAVDHVTRLTNELRTAEGRLAAHEARGAAIQNAERENGERVVAQQTLARELERQRALARDLDRQLAQARRQVSDARQLEARAARQLEQEKRARVAAERQTVQIRNTLSFQLGYELIHGFKSPLRLRLLPGKLRALQKEAARRRLERNERKCEAVRGPASSTLPPSGGAKQSVAVATPTPAALVNDHAVTPRGSVEERQAVPANLTNISALRVACIHDEFTYASYAPECNLLALTPSGFASELDAFAPDLLFVESAWRGKDDLWGKKVSHRGRELVEVVEYCRRRGVPTAFWNKEDPVHFGTFVNTAKLFDYVFTTDVDCIPRYKRALGHDHVYLLPFACQPAQHNPLEKYSRKDALCFAGAYYARYPERQRDLESFALHFRETPRLEIFDRNYGKDDPNYAFPDEYRQFIVGTLAFEEIDRAYKGYRYALNLNSIKDSQTMFARRVYELLASNTITVSNFSRGVRLMFGDLVVATDRGELAFAAIQELEADPARARRLRLAGLRKALSEHTYGHRLRFIASKIWGQSLDDNLPDIVVLARARTSEELTRLTAAFARQSYSKKKLVVVTDLTREALPIGAEVVTFAEAQQRRLGSVLGEPQVFLATFSARDYYGRHYLFDLALTTTYSKASIIGKVARYVADQGKPTLENDGTQYRKAKGVAPRCALIRASLAADRSLGDWLDAADRPLEHADALATDEFNYCAEAASLAPEALAPVDDLVDLDPGLSLERLTAPHTMGVKDEQVTTTPRTIGGERLAALFKVPAGKPVTLSLEGGAMLVQSSLGDEAHEYIYANEHWRINELGLPYSTKLHLDASPGLNLQLAVRFLDSQKQRLGHQLCAAAKNETLVVPTGTELVQLGLRVYGVGSAKVSSIVLGHLAETPGRLFGRADVLLLTNHYPAYDDLYRNGFVHRRVVDYLRQGVRVDVFRHRQGHKLAYREFEGIDVLSGGDDALATLLTSNKYRAVLVHFLDPAMWEVLHTKAQGSRVLLWLHGAEVQAWHRRAFNEQTDLEREEAKARSAKRDLFWQKVHRELPFDGKFVFVSRQFAEQTLTDLGLPKDEARCHVIHNLVDGRLFRYREKSSELRKKILSIRPFASRKYANDLSVKAIMDLSRQPFFEDMSFHLIGDGPLFEETVAPLRGLANVRLERGFLTQCEIADLHAEYGVFLCPTRDDTQGVSRDEAMASGLVPVTNRVAAIPEFVDDTCGILAEPESVADISGGLARLYEDPSLFQRLSRAAAARVRSQSSAEQTTEREIALMLGGTR